MAALDWTVRVSLSEQMLQHHSHIHTHLYAVVFLAVKLIKMTSFLHNVMYHHHLSFSLPFSSSFYLILCDSPDPLQHVPWWIVRKLLTGSGLTSAATASVTHFLVCVCVLCTRLWCSVSHDYTQIMSPSLLCQFTRFFKLHKHLCGRSRNTHTHTHANTHSGRQKRGFLYPRAPYTTKDKKKTRNN